MPVMFDDFELPDFPHTVLVGYEGAKQFLKDFEAYPNIPELGFDFETTGTNYMTDTAMGISFATKEHAWYLHGQDALRYITDWLEARLKEKNTVWIAHNIKFEFHFLTKTYGDNFLPANYADTMVMHWLLDETGKHALKEIGYTELGIEENLPEFEDLIKHTKAINKLKRMDQVNPWDIPLDILGPYGAFDSVLALAAYKKFKSRLVEDQQYNIFTDVEMPFVKVLFKMERAGAWIDKEQVTALTAEYTEIMDELRTKWDKLTDGVNPNSPQQLREYLFKKLKMKSTKKTPGGELSTGKLVLQRLEPRDKTGSIKLLREYRAYSKLVNTYLNTMVTSTHDGRLHTSFNQTGTVTGRLSSSSIGKGDGFNLQNIPIRTKLGAKIREAFGAPDGRLILGIDYSQIELRLVAHMTRDENLVRAYLWDADVHQLTATRIGVSDRRVGKTINFGLIYGITPPGIQDQLEQEGYGRPSRQMASNWLQSYFKVFPAIMSWQERTIKQCARDGFITTLLGRRRHISGLDSPNEYYRSTMERLVINSLVQGSAGDVIKLAMLETDKDMGSYGADMLIQVHDEIVSEVDEKLIDDFSVFVREKMEGVKEMLGISVPIKAEAFIGKNWKETK